MMNLVTIAPVAVMGLAGAVRVLRERGAELLGLQNVPVGAAAPGSILALQGPAVGVREPPASSDCCSFPLSLHSPALIVVL